MIEYYYYFCIHQAYTSAHTNAICFLKKFGKKGLITEKTTPWYQDMPILELKLQKLLHVFFQYLDFDPPEHPCILSL